MAANEDKTPQYIKDRIIQDYIQQLIGDLGKYKKAEKIFDPYSLDTVVPLKFESRFRHGVKELQPAYTKTKSAATSMFEVEIMSQIDDSLELSGIYTIDKRFIEINMPGIKERYYIKADTFRKLLSRILVDGVIRTNEQGMRFVVSFAVDEQFLMKYCVKIE